MAQPNYTDEMVIANEELEKAEGVTASERYLARLGKRSFLDLWCYPNLYIDKKVGGVGQGKELCDLLVVCGDHVLIFSDKAIKWPGGSDLDVAWRRWFKRAVKKSVDQVRGAARWMKEHPTRIFLDSECTSRFPLPLPSLATRKVHGIVVARGAGIACRRYFGGGSGSLVVHPRLRGDDHMNPRPAEYAPFSIGDVNPDGDFVHVMDDATLEILMTELDTITDLTNYLDKKANFIRSGKLMFAEGEEDLLADYLKHMSADGEHDFVRPDGQPWEAHETVAYPGGIYAEMLTNPQYQRKKKADEISYVWDRLILAFTTHMIKGTTIVPTGREFKLSEHERGVRYMALEDRVRRRIHAEAIMGAIEKGKKLKTFIRAMIPGDSNRRTDTGFFFLQFAYPEHLNFPDDYEQYRNARGKVLYAYALGLMNRYRHLKRIIGIATEPPAVATSRTETSEDLVLLEPTEWTPELSAQAERVCGELGIMQETSFSEYAVRGEEYPHARVVEDAAPARPATEAPPSGLNRQQRRALKAKSRHARQRNG